MTVFRHRLEVHRLDTGRTGVPLCAVWPAISAFSCTHFGAERPWTRATKGRTEKDVRYGWLRGNQNWIFFCRSALSFSVFKSRHYRIALILSYPAKTTVRQSATRGWNPVTFLFNTYVHSVEELEIGICALLEMTSVFHFYVKLGHFPIRHGTG